MQYFNQIKNRRRSSQIVKPPNPVLTDEDEAFLQRVTSEPEQGPISPSQGDAQASKSAEEGSQQPALNEGAQNIPLPASPEEFGKELGEEERKAREKAELTEAKSELANPDQDKAAEKKKKRWSVMFWKKNADTGKVRNVFSKTIYLWMPTDGLLTITTYTG